MRLWSEGELSEAYAPVEVWHGPTLRTPVSISRSTSNKRGTSKYRSLVIWGGKVLALDERDCSGAAAQSEGNRETPAPHLQRLPLQSVQNGRCWGQAVAYTSAGTVELY
jgi:hypothetical protein